MYKTIYKYTLHGVGQILEVPMPAGARVVHVGEQADYVQVWAEVNPNAEMQTCRFMVVPTGYALPADDSDITAERSEYLGTAHFTDGTVWHVYQLYRLYEGADNA